MCVSKHQVYGPLYVIFCAVNGSVDEVSLVKECSWAIWGAYTVAHRIVWSHGTSYIVCSVCCLAGGAAKEAALGTMDRDIERRGEPGWAKGGRTGDGAGARGV